MSSLAKVCTATKLMFSWTARSGRGNEGATVGRCFEAGGKTNRHPSGHHSAVCLQMLFGQESATKDHCFKLRLCQRGMSCKCVMENK